MKRFIAIAAASVIAVTGITVGAVPSAEVDFGEIARLPFGDINADTRVSSDDVSFMRKLLLGNAVSVNSEAADLNYDGAVNIVDMVRLKKKMAGVQLKSIYDLDANKRKSSVLYSTDSLPTSVSGSVYYVSADGTGTGKGSIKSPIPFSDLTSGKTALSSGDAVLFKRGDVFRGNVTAVSGVFYGAYGLGEKPIICGSACNYALKSWKDEGNSIFSISGFSADVGLVVLNNGEKIGYKKPVYSDVTDNFDFWYDPDTTKLFIKLPKKPEEYLNIEIGTNKAIFNITGGINNVTVDNICFKYTGGHGISARNGVETVTIQNCEIAYIGGSYLSEAKRYGNGIEFWKGCRNINVKNNWIHNIYDSGVSHQGSGEYVASDIRIRENLIEYCGMGSIEYWLSFEKGSDGNWRECYAENVYYINNILRYAGYGFGGEQRPDKVSSHILSDVSCPNYFKGFTISGNIMDQSTGSLMAIGGTYATYPDMRGNKYAQSYNGVFGAYGENSDIVFDSFAKDHAANLFRDSKATVRWY